MLEIFLDRGKPRKPAIPLDTGPGPQELIGYYETPDNPARHHGFFGEVSSSEFINGPTLASAVGLGGAGTAQNNTTPWLKFLIDGKIVFVPKMTLRYSITWQDIYQAGCVYSDDTTGLYPSGTPVLQNKRVTIQGYQFKVGLLSGSNVDPHPNASGYDLITTHGCEWNRLFYNICTSLWFKTSQEGDQWWNYTEAELNIGSGNGLSNLCRESNTDISGYRVVRGYSDVTGLHWGKVTYVTTLYGWRPRLELIQG